MIHSVEIAAHKLFFANSSTRNAIRAGSHHSAFRCAICVSAVGSLFFCALRLFSVHSDLSVLTSSAKSRADAPTFLAPLRRRTINSSMPFQSGFVAIVGRPNAGKSTLVNTLVGQKVAIVSPKPQTTRNRIQGILNREDAQIVLIDTPGIHQPKNVLSRMMMDELQHALEGIDILCLIADASVDYGPGDRFSIEWIKRFHGPVYLLLNKVDRIAKHLLLPLIERYNKEFDFAEIFPISALTGAGCLDLVNSWLTRLPEAPPHFPPDQFTDQPERFLAAEVVREKAILQTRDEVPHAIAVLIDNFEETPKLLRIRATIYVEREGQKGILIGKSGEAIKKIGTAARKELELILGSKIFLELFVKVQANWRQNSTLVRQLDWHRQLEQLAQFQEAEEG
jgi:GTP-binding protein Era